MNVRASLNRKVMLGWVAGGQGLTALGTVVGVRILTQFLDPATFGVVTLALGAAALALGLTCTPLTQAAMYFYPSLAAKGEADILSGSIRRGLVRAFPWLLLVATVVSALYIRSGAGTIWVVLATAAVLFSDYWRSISLCLLNAASEHRRYGLWMALEAWGRPLGATAAALIFSRSAAVVLLAYAVVSTVLNSILAPRVPPPSQNADFDRRMWQYALPLVPLGLMGWANGMSDRYIIGGMLSMQDTGIYAAAYGLASRPLLLMNAAFEQFMRPLYQNAVSAGNTARANQLLRYWLAGLGVACTAVVLIVVFWHDELAAILLGPRFRSGAFLMPWIAAGYGILALSYVFERVGLAHGRTRWVLAVELLSGITAAVMTVIAVHNWGLIGAAVAVPCYFSVQLCSAILLSLHTQHVYRYRPT